MVEIRRSTIIDAPLDEVWAVLRDFNGHERWHPAVASSAIEDGREADQIGAVRNFQLRDGGRIREQLLALSDVETSFTYCILEAPVSLRNYVANVRLRPVTDDDACLWEWRASFDPPRGGERAAQRLRRRGYHRGGLPRRARARWRRGRATPPAAVAGPRHARLPRRRASRRQRSSSPAMAAPRCSRREKCSSPSPGRAKRASAKPPSASTSSTSIAARGSFDLVTPPGVLGMEAAGVVESVGPGVSNVEARRSRRLRLRAARRLHVGAHDAVGSADPIAGRS